MKATKKMFVLNLFLAAMGSVALADGNSNTVTCVGDQATGANIYKERQVITATFDENLQMAHVQEYRVSAGYVCGVLFVQPPILQNTEDDQIQMGCGNLAVKTSVGRLYMPYTSDLQNDDTATLFKGDGTSEQFHCYNGTISGIEDYLNPQN